MQILEICQIMGFVERTSERARLRWLPFVKNLNYIPLTVSFPPCKFNYCSLNFPVTFPVSRQALAFIIKLSPSLLSRESLSQSRAQRKKAWPKKLGSNGIRTHDLCDTSAMLLTLIGAIEPTRSWSLCYFATRRRWRSESEHMKLHIFELRKKYFSTAVKV